MRAGYQVNAHFGVEVFLAPYLQLRRDSLRTLEVNVSRTGTSASTPSYAESTGISGDPGGFSAHVRFFDRTPLVLRVWVGAVWAGAGTSAGGVFQNGPRTLTNDYAHRSDNTLFWSPLAGLEVRFGYRFSRLLSADIGIACMIVDVPRTLPETGGAVADPTVTLPEGPAFRGGAAWWFPVTGAIRFDL